MELKIKDVASLNKLVESLSINGYRLQTAVVWKQWPYNGIDYFAVRVDESDCRVGEGEKYGNQENL